MTSSMIIKSNNCFFISSFDRHFFLPIYQVFHIYKQKNNEYGTKSKTKMFIQANFFVILEAKKLPHLQPSFLSHTFFLRHYQ